MEGFLGLLAFGVLFYVMMRFGCGAHMMHGRGHDHGGGHGGGGAEGGGKDPVCGMQVGADRGYSMMHAGTRHWFCSKTCLDKFEAEPAKYATPQWAMFGVWQKLLPGFESISWKSYLIGLVESYGYGWYFALVWAPLYNFFAARGGDRDARRGL